MGFISFALFEYFALLLLIRYDKQVSLIFLSCSSFLHFHFQVAAKVEPATKKETSDKTRRRVLLMDQFSLFTVPVVYALVVAIFIAKNA